MNAPDARDARDAKAAGEAGGARARPEAAELTAVACSPALAEHAEGPFWDARTGRLGWVDILAGRLWSSDYDGAELVSPRRLEIDRPLGAAVPAEAGGWLLAAGAGFAHLSEDGRLTEIATVADAERVRMNDGKCDPAGRFWAGTMGHEAEPGAGAFFRLGRDGEVRTVLPEVTISNGLDWSPDHRTMYYIDTGTGRVDAFDYDAAGGEVTGRRPVVSPAGGGAPDGMCVDDEGCLWVAMWEGSRVCRYDPDGRLLATVGLPVTNVTSCCFGGPDRSTLFITTSRIGLDTPEPDAGRVFRVAAGVGGPPAAPYRGPLPRS
jgi:sugar lactone lactonase YvrE